MRIIDSVILCGRKWVPSRFLGRVVLFLLVFDAIRSQGVMFAFHPGIVTVRLGRRLFDFLMPGLRLGMRR